MCKIYTYSSIGKMKLENSNTIIPKFCVIINIEFK